VAWHRRLGAKEAEKVTAFHAKTASRFSREKWKQIVLLYRSRIKTFQDLLEQASYCFSEAESYEPETQRSYLENRPLKKHLEAWMEHTGGLPDFDSAEKIEAMTRDCAQGWGIEAKDLIHPLRFALTGKAVSPGLFELMSVLGKEICLERVRNFLKRK